MTPDTDPVPDDERRLHQVLWSLRDYLTDLVVVGGWVPQLYRRYGGLASWQADLSGTVEVDVMVPGRVPPEGRPAISGVLRREGFAPVDPGPSHAIWESEAPGHRVEFLVHHTGPALAIGSVQSVEEQEPLGAIRLPGLELLARFTRVLEIRVAHHGQGSLLSVTVPTLGAFAVSRGAIFHRRADGDRGGKDLAYIHDVLAAGDDVVGMVMDDVRRIVQGSRPARDYVQYAATQVSLAVKRDQPVVTRAARLLAERSGAQEDAARRTLIGYLTDYVELLRERL